MGFSGVVQKQAYLAEWMWLDLWELVLHVVRIHSPNLITSGRAKDFDDLH